MKTNLKKQINGLLSSNLDALTQDEKTFIKLRQIDVKPSGVPLIICRETAENEAKIRTIAGKLNRKVIQLVRG